MFEEFRRAEEEEKQIQKQGEEEYYEMDVLLLNATRAEEPRFF